MKKILPIVLLLSLVLSLISFQLRFRWLECIENNEIYETADSLVNPDRGSYYIFGYKVSDENEDFEKLYKRVSTIGKPDTLALIQINLRNYNREDISEKGLENIRRLFDVLRKTDKHFIVRFLYDTEGKASISEPDNIEIILSHMSQLKDILNENRDIIFIIQGLFTGNWGEMNGSRFDHEDLPILASKLDEILPEDIYMAVRMPAQWRKATGYKGNIEEIKNSDTVARRMGLFNDGMLYSWSDYGTYGESSRSESGYYGLWNRQEELDFQEVLCKHVPNGGEALGTSEYSDLENAIYAFRKMHVTYLNADYDQKTFEKWKNSIVEEDGVYKGFDGYKYIFDHLGYRFVFDKTSLEYDKKTNELILKLEIINKGFAPVYHQCRMMIRFDGREKEKIFSFDPDLSDLAGGLNTETKTYEYRFKLSEFDKDDYNVYVYLEDIHGNEIKPANKPYFNQKGLKIAKIVSKNELF